MFRTLKISFSLKNTYRVNGILYSLKQIPLIKKILPEYLYGVRGLKIFANILSALWEIISVFLGKFLYFLIMIGGACLLYEEIPKTQVFLHLFLLLTVVGGFANTVFFNPSRDKYYAVILMRMDAREYTLVNYACAMIRILVGELPFSLIFGLLGGVPLWVCILLPFSVVGCKLLYVGFSLWDYERRSKVYENNLGKWHWVSVGLLLAAAYGLPAVGVVLPAALSAGLLVAMIPAGAVCIRRICLFRHYREVNQELLACTMIQMERKNQATKSASEKKISADTTITSSRKGFEFFNELFIRRHRQILWNSTRRISYVCLLLICGAMLALILKPQWKPVVNEVIMSGLPYFTFILYMINRGTGFTQALFMNCDHSLLTYSFYKKPGFVLKLFRIRLREIIKINAVPALVIGVGLSVILYVSGGTSQPIDYCVLVVSILCMSVFFSIHYLTIYYLLQPYTAGTEMKGGTYRVVTVLTYLVCYQIMKLRMPTLIFGVMTIVFCIIYSIIASILIYKLAPKTFRLRT